MSEPAAATPPPASGGSKTWIIIVVVAVCSIGAGAASPLLLQGATKTADHEDDHAPAPKAAGHGSGHGAKAGGHGAKQGGGHGGGHGAPAAKKSGHDAYIPFGEVIVNLAEGRLTRYLRVKVILVGTPKGAHALEEKVEEGKATLRNWLIAHLSDKTLRDVTGRASINRIRREILDRFSHDLDPEATGSLRDVLFEEFVVQ